MLGALVALLVAAGTASAADVATRGSLVVRWHSNPATCAERGLCDRSGVLSWRPEPEYASFDLLDANFGFLALYSTQAIARSHRGSEACVDRLRAIVLAEEKVRGENLVRKALAEGMSVTEAFRRYGIL